MLPRSPFCPRQGQVDFPHCPTTSGPRQSPPLPPPPPSGSCHGVERQRLPGDTCPSPNNPNQTTSNPGASPAGLYLGAHRAPGISPSAHPTPHPQSIWPDNQDCSRTTSTRGHPASPTNLLSSGTSQCRPAATADARAAETQGCPREEKGRRVQDCGQGAPEDAQGPGRQLARRAGGQHLLAREPLPPRAPDPSPAPHWPWRGGLPSDPADCGSGRQLQSLQPAPSPHRVSPRGCGRVRLVPSSMPWGWKERNGGWTERL